VKGVKKGVARTGSDKVNNTVGTTSTTAATPTTNSASPSSPAVNLAVPAGFGPLLMHVWVAADPGNSGLVIDDVESTVPGSVYYAEQPAIGDYWAITGFVPSSVVYAQDSTPAGRQLLAQFNGVEVFNRQAGKGWVFVGSFQPGTCSPQVPAPVYTAWDMCRVGS
jgi:hypothetical protein